MKKLLLALLITVIASPVFAGGRMLTYSQQQAITFDTTAASTIDTTIYYIANDLYKWSYVYLGFEYDVEYGSMTTCTVWAKPQVCVGGDWAGIVKTLRATDTIYTDSLFLTLGWDLEAQLKAATAGDSIPKYTDLRLLYIVKTVLADSGATIAEKADSSWYQKITVHYHGQD